MTGVIVCYYTLGEYEAEASRFCKYAAHLGLPLFVQEFPRPRDWFEGVHLRAPFLRSVRKMFPDQVLLSVDADAIIHENPWPHVPDGSWDIAFHRLEREGRASEPLPGTLVVRPTPEADRLLIAWERQNKVAPRRPDRVAFNAAMTQTSNLWVASLPAELCWIFDISAKAYGPRKPVIEHLQASRSYRSPAVHPTEKDRERRIREIERTMP